MVQLSFKSQGSMSAAASAGWRAVYFVKLRTVASFPSQCGRTKALPRREESGARRTRSGGGSGTWEGGRDRLLSSPGDQQQERTGRGSKEEGLPSRKQARSSRRRRRRTKNNVLRLSERYNWLNRDSNFILGRARHSRFFQECTCTRR